MLFVPQVQCRKYEYSDCVHGLLLVLVQDVAPEPLSVIQHNQLSPWGVDARDVTEAHDRAINAILLVCQDALEACASDLRLKAHACAMRHVTMRHAPCAMSPCAMRLATIVPMHAPCAVHQLCPCMTPSAMQCPKCGEGFHMNP